MTIEHFIKTLNESHILSGKIAFKVIDNRIPSKWFFYNYEDSDANNVDEFIKGLPDELKKSLDTEIDEYVWYEVVMSHNTIYYTFQISRDGEPHFYKDLVVRYYIVDKEINIKDLDMDNINIFKHFKSYDEAKKFLETLKDKDNFKIIEVMCELDMKEGKTFYDK